MMKGWEFAGNETLGLGKIEDEKSAWNGTEPVSRMVTNQLNHFLELEMGRLDGEILDGLKTMLENKQRRMWVVVTFTVFLLLHIRELDAGRIIFWKRYKDEVRYSVARELSKKDTDLFSSDFGYTHPNQGCSLKRLLPLQIPYYRIITIQWVGNRSK